MLTRCRKKVLRFFQSTEFERPTDLLKKSNYSVIKSGARASEYEEAITWLVQAQVLRKVRRVTSPALPIRERVDSSSFKLYLNDVGLLSSLMRISSSLIVSPEKLLGEYSGAIAECFVAEDEELAAMGCEPFYYWTSTGETEVDFIVVAHSESIAIEVKAGSNLRSKSLSVFVEKYEAPRVLRFSLQNPNKAGAIENYPLHAIRLAAGVLGRKVESYVPESGQSSATTELLHLPAPVVAA